MSGYADTIYPEDKLSTYPLQLCYYLLQRFYMKQYNSLLDVGCSKGTHLDWFKSLAPHLDTYGVDVRHERISDKHTFMKCDVDREHFPLIDGYEGEGYDVVFSKSVIEHVRNTTHFFNEVHTVLNNSGLFICMTPDWNSQRSHFYDDYTHVSPFTRKGLRDALIINGFKDVGCEYFYQLPFVWKHPWLTVIPKAISVLPQSLKWKNRNMRNTQDRKLIRFSKEKMLLAYGFKS